MKKSSTCSFAGLVKGSEGYLKASFSFDEDWDGCAKIVKFWADNWIIEQTGASYKVGDTTVATDAIDSFKLSSPYYLGNMSKNSAPAGTGVVGKIYYAQIYSGDTLVANMIPVKKSDGTLRLYDKVRKKYIYNDGTGTVTE